MEILSKLINQAGSNNQAGWTFNQVLTFEQASIIKQGGNFINLKCQKKGFLILMDLFILQGLLEQHGSWGF